MLLTSEAIQSLLETFAQMVERNAAQYSDELRVLVSKMSDRMRNPLEEVREERVQSAQSAHYHSAASETSESGQLAHLVQVLEQRLGEFAVSQKEAAEMKIAYLKEQEADKKLRSATIERKLVLPDISIKTAEGFWRTMQDFDNGLREYAKTDDVREQKPAASTMKCVP